MTPPEEAPVTIDGITYLLRDKFTAPAQLLRWLHPLTRKWVGWEEYQRHISGEDGGEEEFTYLPSSTMPPNFPWSD